PAHPPLDAAARLEGEGRSLPRGQRPLEGRGRSRSLLRWRRRVRARARHGRGSLRTLARSLRGRARSRRVPAAKLAMTTAVERELDAARFRAEVVSDYRPFVMRGLVSGWPAVTRGRKSA